MCVNSLVSFASLAVKVSNFSSFHSFLIHSPLWIFPIVISSCSHAWFLLPPLIFLPPMIVPCCTRWGRPSESGWSHLFSLPRHKQCNLLPFLSVYLHPSLPLWCSPVVCFSSYSSLCSGCGSSVWETSSPSLYLCVAALWNFRSKIFGIINTWCQSKSKLPKGHA